MTKPLKKSAADMIAEATAAVASPKVAANQVTGSATEEPKRRNVTKANTKQLTLYLADPTYRQLREIAFNEDTKMHPLILEALDMLFAARGRPQIAQAMSGK
jgi:hypothetical protein